MYKLHVFHQQLPGHAQFVTDWAAAWVGSAHQGLVLGVEDGAKHDNKSDNIPPHFFNVQYSKDSSQSPPCYGKSPLLAVARFHKIAKPRLRLCRDGRKQSTSLASTRGAVEILRNAQTQFSLCWPLSLLSFISSLGFRCPVRSLGLFLVRLGYPRLPLSRCSSEKCIFRYLEMDMVFFHYAGSRKYRYIQNVKFLLVNCS